VGYYDISLNLSPDTVRWVVAPPLEVHERRRMSRGDDANASALTVSVHAGTHVEAPFHFLPDGAGIDSIPLERFIYLSVGHAEEQVPVHRAFLDHGVVLLEGVDLSDIAPGRYELICFPLRLRGLDGAPCRAVLRDLAG
jgi:kynurenine formamidase